MVINHTGVYLCLLSGRYVMESLQSVPMDVLLAPIIIIQLQVSSSEKFVFLQSVIVPHSDLQCPQLQITKRLAIRQLENNNLHT